jgi:hypothetical protein
MASQAVWATAGICCVVTASKFIASTPLVRIEAVAIAEAKRLVVAVMIFEKVMCIQPVSNSAFMWN